MLYFIKKYPISLAIIVLVIYLSFFKPPSIDTEIVKIPHIDKIMHMGMYFVMSGMLWVEFLRNHRNNRRPMYKAWIGALVCPILFSGAVELFQECLTDYRGGDWLDFAANTTGALLATILIRYIIAPKYFKR